MVDLRCEHTLLGALHLATGWIYHHRWGGGLADTHTWQPFGSVPEAFLTVRAALIDFLDFLVSSQYIWSAGQSRSLTPQAPSPVEETWREFRTSSNT
jgi:hypothetical protein